MADIIEDLTGVFDICFVGGGRSLAVEITNPVVDSYGNPIILVAKRGDIYNWSKISHMTRVNPSGSEFKRCVYCDKLVWPNEGLLISNKGRICPSNPTGHEVAATNVG